jgi:hypothetical protein
VSTANEYLARVRTAASCKEGKPASPVANVSSAAPNASTPATGAKSGALAVPLNGLAAAGSIAIALVAGAVVL